MIVCWLLIQVARWSDEVNEPDTAGTEWCVGLGSTTEHRQVGTDATFTDVCEAVATATSCWRSVVCIYYVLQRIVQMALMCLAVCLSAGFVQTLESPGKKDFWILENPWIWSFQALESPGKTHMNVCTNPVSGTACWSRSTTLLYAGPG